MRHGKRDGVDAPKPAPAKEGTQTRAKQTASANENGTSLQGGR
jgi:plasminogen activator inhibitor 1 RNA-binding protein